MVYDYGAAGSIDNRLSRVAAVTNAAGTFEYAAYTYLGAGTIVGSSRELAVDGQNDQTLELTYGTAQNGYAGLDRFGRVVDQLWKLDGVAVDDYSYGYSQAGNRLWKENVVAGDQSVDLDELYSYDELSQLLATERGRLVFDDPDPGDVSLVDEVFGQEWSLDGLGNWVAFDDDGDAQTRQTNAANEITAITGGSVTPAYDAAGNMISGPSPLDDTVQVHYVYDAWNRLVAVYADDSGEPGDLMAQYEYDGFNQRIVKTVYDGEDTTTSEYFYNESWQLLAARTTADTATSATHYVWDLSYVDAPITQLVDANADGDFTDAGDAAYYYTFDANQNVTALLGLVETSPGVFEWQVVERYTYTPYGVATAHDPDWSNPAAPTTDGPLYAGYHFDAETGLYHVRNRQYDPSLGAFTTRDPLEADSNLYRYCHNHPLHKTDPLGLVDSDAQHLATQAARQVGLEFLSTTQGSEWYFKAMQEIDRVYEYALGHTSGLIHEGVSRLGRDGGLSDRINDVVQKELPPDWGQPGAVFRKLFDELATENPEAAQRLRHDPEFAAVMRRWNQTAKQTLDESEQYFKNKFISDVKAKVAELEASQTDSGILSHKMEMLGTDFEARFDIEEFGTRDGMFCGTVRATLCAVRKFPSTQGLLPGELHAEVTVRVPFDKLRLGAAPAAAQGGGNSQIIGTPTLLNASITSVHRLTLDGLSGVEQPSRKVVSRVLWQYDHSKGAWQPTMSIGLAHRNNTSDLAVFANVTNSAGENWKTTITASAGRSIDVPTPGGAADWLQRAFPATISFGVSGSYFQEHGSGGSRTHEGGAYMIIKR